MVAIPGRISLAIRGSQRSDWQDGSFDSASRPSRIWALIEADDGAFFRSDDSGATWQRINDERISGVPHPPICISLRTRRIPTRCTSPLTSFRNPRMAARLFGGPTPHGDNHALWIDPKNSKRMIEGNDGGATITFDGAASWSSEHNQPTADLFSLAIDDQYPYWAYGAQNDEAHIAVPSRTEEGAIPWMRQAPARR